LVLRRLDVTLVAVEKRNGNRDTYNRGFSSYVFKAFIPATNGGVGNTFGAFQRKNRLTLLHLRCPSRHIRVALDMLAQGLVRRNTFSSIMLARKSVECWLFAAPIGG